jgi:putative membrane protein
MRKTAIAVTLIIAAAGSFAATRPTPPPVSGLDDATIVAIFDAANTADIETGNLAKERAATKDAREFGTMLGQVHTAVRQQGRDLAKKLGVTPTPPKDDQGAKDHAAAMIKLRGVPASQFDRAFLEHEQAYHAAVISALNTTLIPAIQNEELKKFVVGLGPAFEGHRQAAANLLKKLPATP